ncbi:hypothetical protein LXL04_011134 [Taraxacum kok-saghyz]
MRGSQLYTALFFPSLEFFPTGFSLASLNELKEMNKTKCKNGNTESKLAWKNYKAMTIKSHITLQWRAHHLSLQAGKFSGDRKPHCRLKNETT